MTTQRVGTSGCEHEQQFNAGEWKALTNEQRIRRCLTEAEKAQLLSRAATSDMKACYAELAEQWLTLAADIARVNRPMDGSAAHQTLNA
jgi:hypothetical protein